MAYERSPGLLTDLYQLTMAAVYVGSGMAERPATFSLFVRDLPPTRGYLVAAGLDGALSYLESLCFDGDDIAYLESLGWPRPELLARLAELRFTGSVRAVPEGTVVFAGEPLLEVTAPLIEAQIAETMLLNHLTTGTSLASKAARYRDAADGRPVADFALRRCQGVDAGMELSRVAALCGMQSTSNVAAARRFGLTPSGTMAHSFVQAHEDELGAFRAFADLFGDDTVLLVDTFDVHQGIEHAVTVGREMRARSASLRGIRLDSGDLAALSRHARSRLDEAGLSDVGIMASGGLDEHRIAELVAEGAPIDAFGVGSDLGVSADAAVLESVYKLVEFDGRPVRKKSPGKRTWPGAKQIWRPADWSGDVLGLADEDPPDADADAEGLLVEVMRAGARTGPGTAGLTAACRRFEEQWGALPPPFRRLREPARAELRPSPGLVRLTGALDASGG